VHLRDTEHEALPNQLSYVTDFAQKPMFVLAESTSI